MLLASGGGMTASEFGIIVTNVMLAFVTTALVFQGMHDVNVIERIVRVLSGKKAEKYVGRHEKLEKDEKELNG